LQCCTTASSASGADTTLCHACNLCGAAVSPPAGECRRRASCTGRGCKPVRATADGNTWCASR
jgi:hypothetical protein